MISHQYQIKSSKFAKTILCPLLAFVTIGALFNTASAIRALPDPLPIVDMDRTVLSHKAWAANQPNDAHIVLVGDSSCLMNVNAIQLARMLTNSAINLGTLSYIDLESHAQLVQCFARTNPDQLKAVLLLLHPKTLRLAEPSSEHVSILREAITTQKKTSYVPPIHSASLKLDSWWRDPLGIRIVREQLIARVVPIPLPGEYARAYGFTRDLWQVLSVQKGSLIDPHLFDPENPRPNLEFRIANRFKEEAGLFKQTCPPCAKVIFGLTPVPISLATPQLHQVYTEMLTTMGAWLQTDCVLTNLPPAMPDDLFASATHLNAKGQQVYTALVAAELYRCLGAQSTGELAK